jgi:hypothetical protein
MVVSLLDSALTSALLFLLLAVLDRIPCFLYHDVIPNIHPARFLLHRLILPESPPSPLRSQRIWHHILSNLGSCPLLPRVTCSSVIFPQSFWITTAVLDLLSAHFSGTVPSFATIPLDYYRCQHYPDADSPSILHDTTCPLPCAQ